MKIKPALRDEQQEPPAAWCDKCRQEVYHGETRYRWEVQWLCPECFREALASEPLGQLALELGIAVETV